MAHLLDDTKGFNAFVSFAQPAWHGLGTILHDAISAKDALEKGGLDFTVLKLPNVHMIPNGDDFEEIVSDNSFFTYRTDANKILGSKLGKDYTVMQNHEALDVVDEILQSGRATIETAGAIDEGRKVFICLKYNKELFIGSEDQIKQYVLIATSHDGSMSTLAMGTNIRVVCNNTLSAALRAGAGKDKIKIRHTANAKDRLQEAAKVLGLIENNSALNEDSYNEMAQRVISKEMMLNYFGNIFCEPKEIKELQEGKKPAEVLSTRRINILDEVLKTAERGVGQNLTMKGSDFTMWTAYNAITHYATRRKYASVSDRANSLLFGGSAELIETAGKLALAPEKIQPMHKINTISGINFN